jgi:metallo-beta-lactamase family protein
MSKNTITFLGGAGSVTGSKYLVESGGARFLIDCGLFQGPKELRRLNWEEFAVEPANIDFIILTHGHLDHCGYLPRLVKAGFKGKIFATAPTLEIAKIVMYDSARIQEEDAFRANREKFTRHTPALPLYTVKDVDETVKLLESKPSETWLELREEIRIRFRYNGHILGACFVELEAAGKRIVFSGDIGRVDDHLLFPPKKPDRADILLIESTYGDRKHSGDPEAQLIAAVREAILEKKGTLIIPSFAVERSQALMLLLNDLRSSAHIPEVDIYLDSPMGQNVLKLFGRHLVWHKLSSKECEELSRGVRIINSLEETYALAASDKPKIIIAGSGMAGGGRVLTYLVQYLGKETATVLLAGYQAEGTRGRALLEGASEIKIFGKYFPVKASVKNLTGLSSHADQQGLLNWMSELAQAPSEIMIVHGEKEAAEGLQLAISDTLGWNSSVAQRNEQISF